MALPTLTQAIEAIMTPSAPVFIIGIIIVVLFPVLLHFILVKSTPYSALPAVLLAGPAGSGKTSLLTLLERGDAPAATHTSQVPQAVELTASADSPSRHSFREKEDAAGTHTKFLLLDTPGHGKLRQHALGPLASATTTTPTGSKVKAVVFVVDAAALGEPDALAPTAAYLHDVLLALQRRAVAAQKSGGKTNGTVPVLVAANKMDLFTALPATLVRSTLEAELSRIRASRSKGLLDSGVGAEGIDGADEDQDGWLGEYGSDKFTFAQMAEFDVDVDVLPGSVTGGDGGAPDVDRWWAWIADKI